MTTDEWILAALDHKGMSQSDLARALGKTRQHIGKWINGTRPRVENLRAISRATGYSLVPLLGDEYAPGAPSDDSGHEDADILAGPGLLRLAAKIAAAAQSARQSGDEMVKWADARIASLQRMVHEALTLPWHWRDDDDTTGKPSSPGGLNDILGLDGGACAA